MAVDTPELCAARREVLLRELDAYDARPLRNLPLGCGDGPRNLGGRPRGSRAAAKPAPSTARRARPAPPPPPPDLVVEVRVDVGAVRLVDRVTGLGRTARNRTEFAAAVVELLDAARRDAAPPT